MRIVCTFIQGNRTRDPDRKTALPGFPEFHDLTIAHEHIDGRAGGSGLPAIVENQLVALVFVNKHESAAAKSGTLWFDQSQDRVCGDGGIDGVTPFLQHLDGSSNCVRVCRSNHRSAAPRRCIVGGCSGISRIVLRCGACSDEKCCPQGK